MKTFSAQAVAAIASGDVLTSGAVWFGGATSSGFWGGYGDIVVEGRGLPGYRRSGPRSGLWRYAGRQRAGREAEPIRCRPGSSRSPQLGPAAGRLRHHLPADLQRLRLDPSPCGCLSARACGSRADRRDPGRLLNDHHRCRKRRARPRTSVGAHAHRRRPTDGRSPATPV